MLRFSCLLFIAAVASPAATISGVVTTQGAPVQSARVFVEPGLGGALLETAVGPEGAFKFEDVPSGLIGIFAYADGYGFGGLSQSVGPSDDISTIKITLLMPGKIGGRVIDSRGNPVAGARITRVLLQGNDKVGIPLAKLVAFGFEEPSSNDEGRFIVPNMPVGGKVAIKVGHQSYAQQNVGGITVGETDARVQMYEGVMLRGRVLSRDGGMTVSNATIVIRTAREPYDTILAKTGPTGEFNARLNPGYYLYQSASMELRSPGWEKLTVSGQEPAQEVVLRVAGTGTLRGTVKDAVTENPIAGAKISLAAFGSPAAVVTTNASGTFEFPAVEGENSLRVEPAPGYLKPDRPVLSLTVKQGQAVDVPTFWLAPLPGYGVQVVDGDQKPVAGVVVRLIRPMQYRWYVTGADGRVSLNVASVPGGGKIVGMAERPNQREGALFSFEANTATEAKVQLLALGSISGVVVTSKEKPVEGAVVGGLFQSDSDEEPLPLWRTVTGADGRFAWNAVVPFVPAACLASADEDTFGRSVSFNVEPGATQDLGRIVIAEPGKSSEKKKLKAKSVTGKKLEWYTARALGTESPATMAGKPAVVMYVSSDDAAMVIDALAAAQKTLAVQNVVFAVVVDGTYSGTSDNVVLLQGAAPGPATTYLVDAAGHVVLETSGMPPAAAVVSLGQSA